MKTSSKVTGFETLSPAGMASEGATIILAKTVLWYASRCRCGTMWGTGWNLSLTSFDSPCSSQSGRAAPEMVFAKLANLLMLSRTQAWVGKSS